MKAIGIVRKIDNLGRIVVPKETRKILEIKTGDAIEIFVEEESIILQKYKNYGICSITGKISPENIKLADGKIILSPEGSKQLLAELQLYILNKMD